MTDTPLARLTRWFHDARCQSQGPNDPCGNDHVKLSAPAAKKALAATSLTEFATVVHGQLCSFDIERAHGAYFAERSDRACGMDGERHIAWLASRPAIAALWATCPNAVTDEPALFSGVTA